MSIRYNQRKYRIQTVTSSMMDSSIKVSVYDYYDNLLSERTIPTSEINDGTNYNPVTIGDIIVHYSNTYKGVDYSLKWFIVAANKINYNNVEYAPELVVNNWGYSTSVNFLCETDVTTIYDSPGDVIAIGDWFRATRYTKNVFNEYFNEYLDGFTPYLLTIKGVTDSVITITGQTSHKSYMFKMVTSEVTKLFFFTSGETIVATDEEDTITKVLSDSVDILDFQILKLPELILKFKADNMVSSGYKDYTFTADKTGYYFIAYWNFFTITLLTTLSDVLLSGQIKDNYGSPHIKYWLCKLNAGDTVETRIQYTPDGGHEYYSACIFLLKNIIEDPANVSLCDTYDRQDGTTIYNIKNDNYKHLILTSWQRWGDNGGDETDTSVKHGESMIGGIYTKGPTTSDYVMVRIYYGDKTNLPSPIRNYSSGWGRGQLVDIITG